MSTEQKIIPETPSQNLLNDKVRIRIHLWSTQDQLEYLY